MQFIEQLRRNVRGEVRSDAISRAVYSVDASIFEVEPQAVCLPRDRADVQTAVNVAREFGIPIVPRGAGTGTTGSCLGRGLVIDLSKHLDRILEINVEQRWVRCEPGVVLDQLNEVLAHHGFALGLELSTSNRATIGGMIANNASGTMVDHLLEVDMVLASGEIKRLPGGMEVAEIADRYRDEIRERFPHVKRRSSGYNLDQVLDGNEVAIIAGSEATLGIVVEAKLKIVPAVRGEALWLIPFDDVLEAMKAVPKLLKYEPSAIELIDRKIIELGKVSSTMRGKLDWLKGSPGALLIVQGTQLPTKQLITDPNTQRQVWDLRKAGLGLLLSRRTYSRAVGFLEDMAVPVDKLASFLRSFLGLLKRHGCEAGIYGHAGDGCLHIRPFLDLRMQTQIDKMLKMMDEATDLLIRFGGTTSGEHGDGRIRSHLLTKMFGRKLCQAFAEVKHLFDPQNLMNPRSQHFEREFLRSYPKEDFKSVFHFDEGLPFAADMCNGNGACRNRDGEMCPSYHAYHDEYHTTRARAQALRYVMNGHRDKFSSQELYRVLEYCIECKACKTACPSQVDMAKMKAEFLHHYPHKTLRDHLFANVDRLAKFPPPPQWLLEKIGIGRPLPKRKKRLSKTLPTQSKRPHRVVLFNDTFTEHYAPQIGHAAIQLLQRLGYEVIVPPYTCCGRAAISKGFLSRAQKMGSRLLETLLPYAKQDIPIVGLEPSCIFTLRDDYPDLIDHTLSCLTLDEFLLSHDLPATGREVALHVHCHQKSLIGSNPTLNLLKKISTPHLIDTGCCGMAGSFGYEKEHHNFSLAIGERHLFPQVRAISSSIPLIASGFSCRTQIEHACHRRPLHLAEFLALFD